MLTDGTERTGREPLHSVYKCQGTATGYQNQWAISIAQRLNVVEEVQKLDDV